MEFLPRTLGTRPRLACEVRAEGVVAARAEDASGVLSAVARVGRADGGGARALGAGSGEAGVRAELVAAVRRALEAVAMRTREVTLVVPDTAVRVLLLDFDALPGKATEAMAVVRFRLKKLLPFDADDAAVSYQVMATSRDSIQVVAVAMPREALAEYEAVVREAGFEPGAVLPSTLAAIAGLVEGSEPVLVVNAGQEAVTTAIVRAGVVLLHRTVDLTAGARDVAVGAPAEVGALEVDAAAPEASPAGTPMVHRENAREMAIEGAAGEVAQAVSVAAAYFEDTLQRLSGIALAAGTLGAERLQGLVAETGIAPVRVVEMVDRSMLGAGAAGAGIAGGTPLGWLAGVRGALAN